jgi:hypothetical protein
MERMKNPEKEWEPARTETGSAFLYLRGEAENLKKTWTEWSTCEGDGVIKVKFDHRGAGPHTFVVERKNKKVALYQAYENKYSLKEYMENKGKGAKVQLPKGGMLMAPDLAYEKVISLLYNGLGNNQMLEQLTNNPQEARTITSEMYQAAFGSTLADPNSQKTDPTWKRNRFGEAITSVAVFVFDNIIANDGLEEVKFNENKVTYYEEIQAIKKYEELINPKNPNQKLTEEEQKVIANIESVKEYVSKKPKLAFLEFFNN